MSLALLLLLLEVLLHYTSNQCDLELVNARLVYLMRRSNEQTTHPISLKSFVIANFHFLELRKLLNFIWRSIFNETLSSHPVGWIVKETDWTPYHFFLIAYNTPILEVLILCILGGEDVIFPAYHHMHINKTLTLYSHPQPHVMWVNSSFYIQLCSSSKE